MGITPAGTQVHKSRLYRNSLISQCASLTSFSGRTQPENVSRCRVAWCFPLLYRFRTDLPERCAKGCTRDLADLFRGYFYTGGRPGELPKARVRDLSVRETKITLTSAKNKKGDLSTRKAFLQ